MHELWCVVVKCGVYVEREEGGREGRISAQRRSRRVVQPGMQDEAKSRRSERAKK
jgi:hypothetical protein